MCKFRIIFPSDNSLYFSLIFFPVGCRQTAPAQEILLLGWLLLASVAWSNADQRQHSAPCGLQRVWEQKAQVLQQCLYSASLFRGEMLKATFQPKSLKVFKLSCAQTGEVFSLFCWEPVAPVHGLITCLVLDLSEQAPSCGLTEPSRAAACRRDKHFPARAVSCPLQHCHSTSSVILAETQLINVIRGPWV